MNFTAKSKLYQRLQEICSRDSTSMTKTTRYFEECYRRYSIPQSAISDYIYGKTPIEDLDDDLLAPLASVLLPPEELDKYYNKKEYASYKYPEKELPTEFSPVIQVAEDQWLGTIDTADLIALYDAGKIRYNPETQRPMRRVWHGKTETYQFYKNDKAINEMAEALRSDSFVPNAITLNVIKDGFEGDISEFFHEAAFHIREIDHFDLLDGYHRFLALRKVALLNPGFEFRMELRITNFTKEKAWQFIFQEDQKTKMTKTQSASYNTADLGSQIVAYLKQKSELGPYISRNGGIIDEAMLVRAIGDICVAKPPKANSEILRLKQEVSAKLYSGLTEIINNDITLLDRRWERDFIVAAVWCCWNNLSGCINDFYSGKGDSKFCLYNRRRGVVINIKELERLGRDYV